eukprot:CAMPEP_0179129230 /NCGR_PEP_ID=MMETSP0796-20121207/61306_1 /TAXON_ID=73915 /ORGANISM="Pyrodinium bahamense, Strain pbaha01" /LENGTH=117 /DNA_ID=CAMNT_0020828101 /DNA_START=138 /DNA_END=489 /DNA_ORIENTATION=-
MTAKVTHLWQKQLLRGAAARLTTRVDGLPEAGLSCTDLATEPGPRLGIQKSATLALVVGLWQPVIPAAPCGELPQHRLGGGQSGMEVAAGRAPPFEVPLIDHGKHGDVHRPCRRGPH